MNTESPILPILNSIMELINEEACVIAPDGQILAHNDLFKESYQLSTGEMLSNQLIDSLLLQNFFNKTSQVELSTEKHPSLKNCKPLILSDKMIGVVCQFKSPSAQCDNERDEKFISLFEQASDPIMITDFEGNVIDANASFCCMFGYSKEEIITLHVTELVDKTELRERPLQFDTLKTGKRVFSQRKMIHKNGGLIDVEANLKKFGANQVMTIVKDITEIKNAQTQIEFTEAQFKGAFENASIGMALVTLQGGWIKINKEFCSIMGYEESELLQLSFADFTHPEDFPICIANLQKIIMGEIDIWKAEKRYKNKNGDYLWINFSASMVKDSKRNPLFIVAQFENITKRKESEIQKEKMTKDLLLQNKNLEQFTYIVSHNLRAPVANLIGLSGLLKDEAYPIEIRNQCINELEASSQRLDRIIYDLNNILQIKREITEKKELVYFDVLVQDIQSSIQNIIINENVTIEADFSQVESTSTLRSYLYSIFFNLITNSIKYRHPDRNPLIKIYSELNSDKILLHFSDNGLGIDMEKHKEQLFGLYKRFHLHTEGKGMGLFVVKTQVETLGGTIEVEGKLNEGLAFKIELPK